MRRASGADLSMVLTRAGQVGTQKGYDSVSQYSYTVLCVSWSEEVKE